MRWIEKLKEAWYRDNYFPIPFEKDEAWREMERHANIAYRFIKEELHPSPLPSNEDELWNEAIDIVDNELCMHGSYSQTADELKKKFHITRKNR